ncbi:unnamed protein product [Discosporangium mesarthrocarpum]
MSRFDYPRVIMRCSLVLEWRYIAGRRRRTSHAIDFCSRRRLSSRAKLSIPTASPWVWTVDGMDADQVLHRDRELPPHAEYMKPAAFNHELPTDGLVEVAFSGRSNAGKSTLIGTLIRNTKLVRTSKNAGCTTMVNYYGLRNGPAAPMSAYLVDLPGYGFARQSRHAVRQWTEAVHNYLIHRPPSVLKRTLVLVDIRHGLQPGDLQMMGLLDKAGVGYQVVLTKVDKVTSRELVETVEKVCRSITWKHPACLPVVYCISSVYGSGMQELSNNLCYIMDM